MGFQPVQISKRVFHHRGYVCWLKHTEQRIRCRYQMTQCNVWMPREFFWNSLSIQDCGQYIDLLCSRKLVEAKKLEEARLASEHVYASPEIQKQQYVNISPLKLMALLRGEEVLDVPINSRIRFVPKSNRYSVNDLDAELFSKEMTEAYFYALMQAVGNGTPVAVVSNIVEKIAAKNAGLHLADHKATSGCSLALVQEAQEELGVQASAEVSPSPVEETCISSRQRSTHTETVTLISGQGKRPYFVKRLLRGEHLLWCGTSYAATGPWAEYHRDDSRLTALKITIA